MKHFSLNTFIFQCVQQKTTLLYLLVLLFSWQPVQALETGLHYYLIKNVETGQITRRDEAGSNGIIFNNVFLAPNTRYQAWLLQAETLKTASVEFTMPRNGRQLNAPEFFLAPSSSPDTDYDGLHDDGEFIMGTLLNNPDSDNDGIKDGAEVKQGTDPLDGKPVRTGIIGTATTSGKAIGVCALNDIVAVADAEFGISVFNVFNGMQPLLIAQVDTPGNAVNVACSANRIVVADSHKGIAIVDISDPSTAKVVHQLNIGNVVSVAVEGTLLYASLETGAVVAIDINSGVELARKHFNEAIDDINVTGDFLYILGQHKLYIYSTFSQGFSFQSSLSVFGLRPFLGKRRPLFVGDGIAYIGHFSGYSTVDVSNPAQPELLGEPGVAQSAVHDIVLNGSGLLLNAISTSFTNKQVALFDGSDPLDVTQLLTSFETPGVSEKLAIYNGLAYVADATSGLQVLNYLAFDSLGLAPNITLSTAGDTGDVVAGQNYRLTADVNDDVQVRNVEFYVNGEKVATDGDFPFEVRLLAPALSQQQSIIVQARASDTGGNFTWTEEMVLGITPDNIRPQISKVIPDNNKVIGSLNTVTAVISEPVDPLSVDNNLLTLIEAGVDETFGTGDDQLILDGQVAFSQTGLLLTRVYSTPLQPGKYQGTVSDALMDFSGNTLEAPVSWQFTIYDVGADRDADGVPDALEQALGLDPDESDSDGNGILDGDEDFDTDGLGNADEVILGFDATNPDSDADGVNDAMQDSDQDGITDADEVLIVGSDRFDPDTDDDGAPDGIERLFGSGVFDINSQPIDVSVSNAPVVAGETVIYQLTLSNLSNNTINGVAINYLTPTGISFHEFINAIPNADNSGCGGTSGGTHYICSAGEEAVWTLGTLAAGESRKIQLEVLVDSSVPDDSLITAQIFLNASLLANRVGFEKSFSVTTSPTIEVALGTSSDPVKPDQRYSYLIDVGNTTNAVKNNVELLLAIPANVLVETISNGGVFDNATGEVIWIEGSLPIGSTVHREVDVKVVADAENGIILKSRLDTRIDGKLEVDKASEKTVTVDTEVALTGLIVASPNPVIAGGDLEYQMTISNESATAVENVFVTLRTPRGISFHEFNNVVPNAENIGCGGTSTGAQYICTAGEEGYWSLGTLAAGESQTIQLTAFIDEGVADGTLITMPMVVSGTGVDRISLERTIVVNNTPVIELALAATSTPINPGQSYNYLIDVGNTTDAIKNNVELRLEISTGVTVETISNGGVLDNTSGEVVWTEASLPVGSAVHREVMVKVAADAENGVILRSRLKVHLDGNEAVYTSIEKTITVDTEVALTGLIVASPNPVIAGGDLEYQMTISNASASDVDNVFVTLRTPRGISFHEFNNVVPNAENNGCGGTSTGSHYICTAGEEGYWSLGTLAVGESQTIQLTAFIDEGVADGTLITMPMVVSGTGIDRISLERTIVVNNTPVIELALAATSNPINPGQSYNYLIDVGNTTDAIKNNVELRLEIPMGVTVETISDGGVIDNSSGEVVWTEAILTVGEGMHREVEVLLAADALNGTILRSRLEARIDGNVEIDQVTEQTVTVDSEIALTGLIVASPNPVAAEGQLDYQMTITNESAAPVDDVTVLLRTPKGISFHEFINTEPDADNRGCGGTSSGTHYICVAGEEGFWVLGTLAAGESRTIQFSATVDAGLVDGTLITMPMVISGTGVDSINLERTVLVQ